jgi:hypothetical protein
MTVFFVHRFLAVILSGGAQTLSVQVVDPLWLPIPGVEVRVAPVLTCAQPKPTGEARDDTTGKSGEVQLPAPGRMLLLTASMEGFEPQEQCIELGAMAPGETAKVQIRLRLDFSTEIATHSATRAKRSNPSAFEALDLVGVYRDSLGQFYRVSYSEQPFSLALNVPSGATIYFSDRDGLSFRSAQGSLVFHLLDLIRFGGHLPKGGYDVPNGRNEKPTAPSAVHG